RPAVDRDMEFGAREVRARNDRLEIAGEKPIPVHVTCGTYAGLAPVPRATRYSPMTSFIGLRAIAAKILELFRSPDQPPLAQSPFFVGGRKATQAVDFLTCHFRRFRSCLGPRSCPLGARKPQLDKPADGFGARRIVLLRRRPAIDARKCSGLKTQADQRAL